MGLRSSFKNDLEKEQKLSVFLDAYYKKHLKHYIFERAHDLKRQIQGVDLVLAHNTSGRRFLIDEKAQLDYINEDLPTFAFELVYQKDGEVKKGWLFNAKKKTEFYALITSIYADEPEKFTSCKVTFVNRKKLIEFLNVRKINQEYLDSQIEKHKNHNGKIVLDKLHPYHEGYLYFSTIKKAEKPINLILKLAFLTENGIAKQL
ncbi:hypothetical protein MNBD_BACTEROID03-2549 [hydrothermal vent metagenome]|uniref:Uncharacterized protein n=1 Tax=hydrothermal vent metagenome TaxID=652676 RepID=A0A3B0T2Q5_9ZZZZ